MSLYINDQTGSKLKSACPLEPNDVNDCSGPRLVRFLSDHDDDQIAPSPTFQLRAVDTSQLIVGLRKKGGVPSKPDISLYK